MRGHVPTIHCDDEGGCAEWAIDFYTMCASNWRDLMEPDWIYDPHRAPDTAFCPHHAAEPPGRSS